MTARREFSTKTKAEAFTRCDGRCKGCGWKLMPGRHNYDHIVPAKMGGGNDIDNCAVLCLVCHGVKTTKTDVPRMAKIKRVRAKHFGFEKKRKAKIPGSKGTRFKKKIDGTVVLRQEGKA